MPAALYALLLGCAAFLVLAGFRTLTTITPSLARAVFAGAAALAVIGAAMSNAAPTGIAALDCAYRVAVGVACVVAASFAQGVLLPVCGIVAIVAVAGAWSGRVAFDTVAFAALALGTAAANRRKGGVETPIAAIAGAFLANAILRLPTSLPIRVPTLVAGSVIVVLAVVAIANRTHRARMRLFIAISAGCVVCGLGAAGGALAALGARSDADDGIRSARAALDAVRSGDVASAQRGLTDAAAALQRANDRLTGPTTAIARYLPVVGPNLAAVRVLTAAGADVARQAAAVVAAVDPLQLRAPDGRIDVERLDAMRSPLRTTRSAIDRAIDALERAHSPWLVPQLVQRSAGLRSQLVRAQSSGARAADMLDALPDLLGLHGPRRYLVVVPTPAEARGSGGLIGNYGEISAVDGRLKLERFGRTAELFENGITPAKRILKAPADYMRRYARFEVNQLWQNVTLSPDFPSSAEAMAGLDPQSGGSEIDGIISADPFALAGFLRITGPISVADWPESFTAENTPRILLYDFYAQLTETRNNERIDLQRQVAERAWQQLLGGPMPSPATLSAALSEPIRQRHLQLWSRRPLEQAFLQSAGVSGAVPALNGDWFSAIVNNAGANKIEWYLHRDITYDAAVDLRTGEVRATALIEMRNDAPASGVAKYLIGNTATPPAPTGTSVQYLSLYSPLQLTSVALDGAPVTVEKDTELGRNVWAGWIRVPPGARATLTAQFAGHLDLTRGTYAVQFGCQAMVNPDQVHVRLHVTAAPGERVQLTSLRSTGGAFSADGPLDCTTRYVVRAIRTR